LRRRTLCYWCGCSSGKDKARLTPKFEKLVRKHVPGSESYRTADFRTPDGLCHSCRGKLTCLEEGKIHRFPKGVPPAFDWQIDKFQDPGDNYCACVICVRAPVRNNLKQKAKKALKNNNIHDLRPKPPPAKNLAEFLVESFQDSTSTPKDQSDSKAASANGDQKT